MKDVLGCENAKYVIEVEPMLQKKAKFQLVFLSKLLKSKLTNGIFKKQEFYGSGMKLVNVWDLYQGENIQFETLERINITDEEAEPYTVAIGDIFFCRSSLKPEGIAWTSFVETMPEPAVFECHLIKARPDIQKVIPAFLASYCKTNIARMYLLAKATITTMATIDQTAVQNLPVVLPPLEIQRQLIDALNMSREYRRRKLKEAEELLSGMDSYLLETLGLTLPPAEKIDVFAVRLGQVIGKRIDAFYNAPYFAKLQKLLLTCPYTKISIGSIAPDIVGGATPTRGDAELYADDGIKFLRILNVRPFEIVIDNIKYIQPKVYDGELARSKLMASDVLMTITGRVGTAAVVPQEILPANINQHIVRLRIQRNDCLPEYLAAWLNSSIGYALSNREVTGGTRIALDYKAIRNLQIPIPPIKTQRVIAIEIRRRREDARRLRGEAEAEWSAAKAKFEKSLLE